MVQACIAALTISILAAMSAPSEWSVQGRGPMRLMNIVPPVPL